MMLCIADVFDRNETAAIRKRVEALKFVDGRSTAGWVARLVKDNEQADPHDRGALVIETVTGEQAFKLAAGSMIVYPTNTLHRVAPVDSGERLAAVGWARSFVRSPERREILFDLETARRELFDTEGKSSTFDQLSKCSANLLRMWADD